MGAMRSFWASKVECCFCQVVSIRQSINLDPGTPGFQARNAGGLENFDGTRGPVATAIADGSTHLSQEGVSEEHPCYHAFNDQTAKRELGGTIWDIANPGNAYSQAHVVKLLSHSDFEQKIKKNHQKFPECTFFCSLGGPFSGPMVRFIWQKLLSLPLRCKKAGLNVESVYWCSSRDIERTRQMGNREVAGGWLPSGELVGWFPPKMVASDNWIARHRQNNREEIGMLDIHWIFG